MRSLIPILFLVAVGIGILNQALFAPKPAGKIAPPKAVALTQSVVDASIADYLDVFIVSGKCQSDSSATIVVNEYFCSGDLTSRSRADAFSTIGRNLRRMTNNRPITLEAVDTAGKQIGYVNADGLAFSR